LIGFTDLTTATVAVLATFNSLLTAAGVPVTNLIVTAVTVDYTFYWRQTLFLPADPLLRAICIQITVRQGQAEILDAKGTRLAVYIKVTFFLVIRFADAQQAYIALSAFAVGSTAGGTAA